MTAGHAQRGDPVGESPCHGPLLHQRPKHVCGPILSVYTKSLYNELAPLGMCSTVTCLEA